MKLSYKEQVALLTAKPWLMSFEEIGNLTTWQINYILFHERDEHGMVKVRGTGRNGQRTKVEVFREYHLSLGKTNEEIDLLLEQCRQEALAAQRQQAGLPPEKKSNPTP